MQKEIHRGKGLTV